MAHTKKTPRFSLWAHLFLSLLCILSNNTLHAQPSWGTPPPAASMGDQSLTALVAASGADVETINCDMYTDVLTGFHAFAIVWDEYDVNSGIWRVYVEFRDNAHASTPLSKQEIAAGQNVRHPDVALGNANPAPDQVAVGIVYEKFSTGEVVYTEYELQNLFTGSPTSIIGGVPTVAARVFNADPLNDAREPHIDAVPRYFTSPSWFTSSAYQPLRDFVLTWTEYDGGDEIWVDKGEYNVGPNLSPLKVDAGIKSDVAGVLVDDVNPIAYVAYIDGGGDIQMEEFDISGGTPSSNATTPIQSSMTVSSPPRIDAPNVVDGSSPPNILWGITAAVVNPGSSPANQEEIRWYDDVGMVNFGSNAPYTSLGTNQGYNPAVAIGPGPNDYNGTTSNPFGDLHFIHAGFINDAGGVDNIVATDYDIAAITPVFGAYQQVCSLGIHSNVFNPPLAVGTSSNCGEGHIAAWYNYIAGSGQFVISYKINTGTGLSFKPGKPTSIVATQNQNDYNAYPNPAAEYVMISGLKTVTAYAATDITGRTVLQGTASPSKQKIDISQLPQGVYIFNFNEAGTVTQLKLVKQ